jgi:rfaE bifunctional protein kinase chain/domain
MQAHELIARFRDRNVLVLGDLILDWYWWGRASRLSPEAPVPVILKQRATSRAGGAANTAANLAALGAGVEVIGALGDDAAGAELRRVLRESEVGACSVLVTPDRPTTTKTRIIALQQHVVRVDEEVTSPLSDDYALAVMDSVERLLPSADGILISDYAKGFLTPYLLQEVIARATTAGKPTFVDPKGMDHTRYAGCSYLKPNRLELGLLTGSVLRNHEDTLEAGRRLLPQLGGSSLLVTEGEEGMTLFQAGGGEIYMPSLPRQVFDVTGAGDTVLATFALSILSGAPAKEALRLAVEAANIAVGTVGTATVTGEMLSSAVGG